MKYLLDSDVLIDLVQGRIRVVRHIRELFREPASVSAVAVGELYDGLSRPETTPEHRQRIEQLLGDVEILNFDRQTAEIFEPLRYELERIGKPLDDVDLMIASTALQHGLTLASLNRKHFGRIQGLFLFDFV